MNSKPLEVNHGAPVRIIAPGIAGARSVKWLECITVQAGESGNYYQQRDYKTLPPEATCAKEAERFWDATPAIQEMPINSVIGIPQSGETVRADADETIKVRGYALPQGSGGPVVKVEVSMDEGRSWKEAELSGERSKWSWTLWETRLHVARGKKQRILSRATDKAGNMQRGDSQWNLRGIAYHGYGEARDIGVL
jgi:sulfite oxidase